ncbi:MAG TPA: PEGA domain-containing protein, partial [Kofleriaceae bacterium]|nr:PEGA domain-containing protein [Kofleriaceae bacterium]
NRPITLSGSLEEHIAVTLEKADAAPAPQGQAPAPRPVEKPIERAPPPPAPARAAPAPGKAAAADKPTASDGDAGEPQDRMIETGTMGVLVLGSKPPCEIAIDGSPTGQHTPQKDLKLPLGRHKVTLSNSEYNIRETFSVDIKADEPEKIIKDYSDRLP